MNGSKGETGPKGEKGEPGFRGETGLKVKLMVYRTSIWKIHYVNVIGRLISLTYSASATVTLRTSYVY